MSTANLADHYLEKTDLFPNHVSVNLIHLMLRNSLSVIIARLDSKLMTPTPWMLVQLQQQVVPGSELL